LPRLFAQFGRLRVGGAQRLVPAKRVRRKLAKLAHSATDFLMVLIPIHDHGDFSCLEKFGSRAIILPARANMISSQFTRTCQVLRRSQRCGAPFSSCAAEAVELIPRSRIHEEFV